ncbi:hypothetical protein CEXT_638831 [Caerostris extrusa]|uniref:Uncharacterized protein n=1 Tax=Caerostris extrusa TaxID=172846 RepID=A0AAV4X7U7_CAEEX|nr:hypothetical protein CEXT_638831 [Caerostris extrusa]
MATKLETCFIDVTPFTSGKLGNASPLTHGGARHTHTTTPFSKCRSLRLARLPILNSGAKRQYCVQPAKILAREIATLPQSFVQPAVHLWVKCMTFY